ncbi:hypothetical protein NQ318_003355 [Aromia moschata]|uniref:ZAD domain-containing protein n=1 Tax=Aromia moschata TaxID=1265417 RepID=A0AAV8Y9A9_9CUCU|nr:hypothetical protein NQ318_003355 [Aromia moschata]
MQHKKYISRKIENVLVSVAIMECIYPIEILKNDKLSKEICLICLESLTSYFKFRSVCLENDKKQRDLYHDEIHQTEPCTSTSDQHKRSANGDQCPIADKKQRIEDHIFSDSEDDYSDQDDLDSLSDFIVKSENTGQKQNQTPTLAPPPLIPLQKREKTRIVIKQTSSEIDKKFDKVEEELRKVLEGQLTEEQAQAENIIIHVENDEEEQSPDKVATLTKLKLPIVIKPVYIADMKQEAPATPGRRSIIEGDSKIPTRIITTDSNIVTLPKGINVSVNEVYKSDVGVFEGTPLIYVFNTEFCQVDGYLYEYRLCKGNTRFLRCVLPACHALAVQNKVASFYTSQITVQKPHSHKRPDEVEKKKQMFYYVMKRKMQSDKTLNFRSVYEEVCKSDPEIKDLVPLLAT